MADLILWFSSTEYVRELGKTQTAKPLLTNCTRLFWVFSGFSVNILVFFCPVCFLGTSYWVLPSSHFCQNSCRKQAGLEQKKFCQLTLWKKIIFLWVLPVGSPAKNFYTVTPSAEQMKILTEQTGKSMQQENATGLKWVCSLDPDYFRHNLFWQKRLTSSWTAGSAIFDWSIQSNSFQFTLIFVPD